MSVERFPATEAAPRGTAPDFSVDGCVVRPSLNRVETLGETVALEPKVMRVLLRLAERPGAVVTKEELFRDVWEGAYVTDDVLTRAIGELRRLFGDDASRPRVIETIRKSGYRLIARVSAIEAEPAAIPASEVVAPSRGRPGASARIAIAGAVAVAVAAVVAFLLRERPRPAAPVRIRPVTSYPGNERDPAVSPDGTRVAFAWNGGRGEATSLYVALLDSEAPLRLTSERGVEDRTPAWSPDGQRIAFTRATSSDCQIRVVSALGGSESPLAPCGDRDYRRLAWSADGRALVLSRRAANGPLALELLSVDTHERRAITHPPDGILGDTSAAFSPDGRSISFTRNRTDGVNDIYVVDTAGGEPRRLTFDDRDTMGSAWSDDGASLIFSSSRGGIYSLWRVPVRGGEPSWVAGGGTKLKHPSAALAKRLVAFENWIYEVNLWRIPTGPAAGAAPLRLTEATDEWNFEPHVSPDGRRVAFVSTRSGSDELWVVAADGGPAKRLTSFGGARLETPRWSPDGRTLVFAARVPARADLYSVPAEGGVPRRLTNETSDAVVPRFARDGRSIYFASRRGGAGWEVWRLDPGSGRVAPVTRGGGYAAEESWDGRSLYFTRPDAPGIWKQSVAGEAAPAAELVTDRLAPEDWSNWAVGKRGLYLRVTRPGAETASIAFLAEGAREPVDVAPLTEQGQAGFDVSADGAWFVYPRADRHTCDIRAIENPS